jgi:hypothetical protein
LARQICKSVALVEAIELGRRAATAEVTDDLEAALPAVRLNREPGEHHWPSRLPPESSRLGIRYPRNDAPDTLAGHLTPGHST